MIEILTTGAPNTVQDGGRRGHLASGISGCGAMDPLAFGAGNALLGNPEGAASIEIALFPFRLRFDGDTRFALTGADCGATLDTRPMPPFWTCSAKVGQVLSLAAPCRGARAYLAFEGGIAVPLALGSRSTDLKCGFGGLEGRGLRRGDKLAQGEASRTGTPREPEFGAALPAASFPSQSAQSDSIAVRVIKAAEYDSFDVASRAAFEGSDWQVGSEANRMGYRLSGPTLRPEKPLELFSHGIVPGIVQVPSNGQPIIQLADANTCGGYPKIATVIEADLWRIAQTPVGARLRLVLSEQGEALDALRIQAAWLAEVRGTAARFLRSG